MIAATAAFAIMACNQVDLPQNQEARLDLQVRTGIATRGVITEKTLPSGSSVGLFVTDDSNVTYDGVAVANIRYTGTGEGDSQAWAADEDIMLSATKGTLKGYYPYSESIIDLTAIPVEATSDIQTDWMYATPVANLNNRNFTAIMTMNHALAGVRLSLVKGSYNGVGEISSVSLSSDGAATSAVLDATDGSLSSITGAGASYTSNETFSLAAEKKSFDFITVPAGVEAPIALSVMMNRTEMIAEIPAVKLQSGKIYEYIVEVAAEGLLLQGMNVIDWNKIDKGTLELQPDNGGSTEPDPTPEPGEPDTPSNPDIDFDGTVPDPFVEWARIQHKNGTLYTAEEWLAAETAGTVADADANGVVVLYSRYAVCPHVIHPKYSTNAMEWSSNTSVEVPGVTTASDKATAQLDVNGKANTDAILAAVAAGTIEDAPAAQYCVDVTFADGKKGYLPAAGELKAWFDNKTAVNACMDAIGGDQIDTTDSWSSTQCSALYAWYWAYYNDALYMGNHSNDTDFYVRSVVAFEYN